MRQMVSVNGRQHNEYVTARIQHLVGAQTPGRRSLKQRQRSLGNQPHFTLDQQPETPTSPKTSRQLPWPTNRISRACYMSAHSALDAAPLPEPGLNSDGGIRNTAGRDTGDERTERLCSEGGMHIHYA